MKKFEEINGNAFGILKQSEISNLNLILGGSNSTQGCGTSTQTDGTYYTKSTYTQDGKVFSGDHDDCDNNWVAAKPEDRKICKDTIG